MPVTLLAQPLEQSLTSLNKAWATSTAAKYPQLFLVTGATQTPKVLWLGCCDSRVPESSLLGVLPGEVFVHRNIGNIIHPSDVSWPAALSYAVDEVKVSKFYCFSFTTNRHSFLGY
jgi:carbonic anhydrase